jgi:hypothetical protein
LLVLVSTHHQSNAFFPPTDDKVLLVALTQATGKSSTHEAEKQPNRSCESARIMRSFNACREPDGEFPIRLIADVVELRPQLTAMRQRATGVRLEMLDAIERLGAGHVFLATARMDAEGDEQHAILALGPVPKVVGPSRDWNQIDLSPALWVAALVSDAGSGQGIVLLNEAERIGRQGAWPLIALAAYEDDIEGPAGYSSAPYYQKQGYLYSGEATEEKEGDDSYFYPIYYKKLAASIA